MIVVRSETHRRHHSLELDLSNDRALVGGPGPAEHVDRALDEQGTHKTIGPDAFGAELVDEVHDPEYVRFLAGAWTRWQAGAIRQRGLAFGWPARGSRPSPMPRSPTRLLLVCCRLFDQRRHLGGRARQRCHRRHGGTTGARRRVGGLRPLPTAGAHDEGFGVLLSQQRRHRRTAASFRGHAEVAVLDVDYHHGNGTQDIFYGNDDVHSAVSMAILRRNFPTFGPRRRTRRRSGHRTQSQPPAPQGTGRSVVRPLEQAIGWLNDSSPTALVVSLGLDTFVDDPISHFGSAAGLHPARRRLAAIELPTVLVMEGGYALATRPERGGRTLRFSPAAS